MSISNKNGSLVGSQDGDYPHLRCLLNGNRASSLKFSTPLEPRKGFVVTAMLGQDQDQGHHWQLGVVSKTLEMGERRLTPAN